MKTSKLIPLLVAYLMAAFTLQADHSEYHVEFDLETGIGLYEESGYSDYLGQFFREGTYNQFGEFDEFGYSDRFGPYFNTGEDVDAPPYGPYANITQLVSSALFSAIAAIGAPPTASGGTAPKATVEEKIRKANSAMVKKAKAELDAATDNLTSNALNSLITRDQTFLKDYKMYLNVYTRALGANKARSQNWKSVKGLTLLAPSIGRPNFRFLEFEVAPAYDPNFNSYGFGIGKNLFNDTPDLFFDTENQWKFTIRTVNTVINDIPVIFLKIDQQYRLQTLVLSYAYQVSLLVQNKQADEPGFPFRFLKEKSWYFSEWIQSRLFLNDPTAGDHNKIIDWPVYGEVLERKYQIVDNEMFAIYAFIELFFYHADLAY